MHVRKIEYSIIVIISLLITALLYVTFSSAQSCECFPIQDDPGGGPPTSCAILSGSCPAGYTAQGNCGFAAPGGGCTGSCECISTGCLPSCTPRCSGKFAYTECTNLGGGCWEETVISCPYQACPADVCSGINIYTNYPSQCRKQCDSGELICLPCTCTALNNPDTSTCSQSLSCQTQACGTSNTTCHRSNAGAWQWDVTLSAETACTDGYDNDCDLLIDCGDPDCTGDPSCQVQQPQTPTVTINNPPASTWFGPNYEFTMDVSDQGSNLVCEYRVESGSIQTYPAAGWATRTCSSSQAITVGNTDNCRTHGADTCEVFVKARDTVSGLFDEKSRRFSIDLTNPIFNSLTVTGCTYLSGNDCWVKQGVVTHHRISHTDTGSLPSHQYLSFAENGCTPNNCIPTGNEEVKSYAYAYIPNSNPARFVDWLVNNNYLDIASAQCSIATCIGVQTVEQDFSVIAGSSEGDFQNWVFMYDKVWNYVGYTPTAWWYRLDNTNPTATISINGGAGQTTSSSVSLTLDSADSRSGIDGTKCKYWNENQAEPASWSACDASPKAWTLSAGNGNKTVFFKVSDNVGKVFTANDTIQKIDQPPGPDAQILTPAASSWQRQTFQVNVNDTNFVSCAYFVWSNGFITQLAQPRTCDSTVPITVGSGMDCFDQGINMCLVRADTSNGVTSTNDRRNFSIDWTPPLFGSYSVRNCDYVNGTACWVKQGTTTLHDVNHYDAVSTPYRQLLSFITLGCTTPSFCGAGNEAISYIDVDIPQYVDYVVNDGDMNILNAVCNGICTGQNVTERWTVSAGPNEDDFKAMTFLYDHAWNQHGWYDTGHRYRLDNTPPTASVVINSGAATTNSPSVTLTTLTRSDSRSGINNTKCKIWNDGIPEPLPWSPCSSAPLAWTLRNEAGIRTVYYKVSDNVGWNYTASDTIEYLQPDELTIQVVINGDAQYTNTPSVTLEFTRSSATSGANGYKYWNDGQSEPVNWLSLPVPLTWQTNHFLAPGPDGTRIVWAKIRNATATATDSDDIILDTTPPVCNITTVYPAYVRNPFNVSWTYSDNLAGIQTWLVQYQAIGVALHSIADDYCSPGPPASASWNVGPSSGIVTGCDATRDGTHFVKCYVLDLAGNSQSSPYVNVQMDNNPPNVSMDSLPLWMGPNSTRWAGNYSVNVSWIANDPGSGISCTKVYWSLDKVNWSQIGGCMTFQQTSARFDRNITFVNDGVTYYFRINSTDNSGQFALSNIVNTTIDTIPPEIRDFRAVLVGNQYNITSNVTDSISGIATHRIEWDAAGVTSGALNCGAAAPFGGYGFCSTTAPQEIALSYSLTVTDRAGNSIEQQNFEGSKFVNFVDHNIFLVVGGTYSLKVQVRNLGNQVENITLDLVGDYNPGLAKFVDIGIGQYQITNNGRRLVAIDMEPFTQETFFINILASEPDFGGKYLTVDASTGSGMFDDDQALIVVSWPVSFWSLNELAVLLLLAIAVAVFYLRFSKK